MSFTISEKDLGMLNQVIIDHSMEAMIITDMNYTILVASKVFSKISGHSAEELVGNSLALLQSDRHAAEFYGQMIEDISTNGEWKGEIWIQRKSGDMYPAWTTVRSILDHEGVSKYYLVMVTDISSLEYLPSAVYIVNNNGIIMHANQKSVDFFGAQDKSFLVGLNIVNFMMNDKRAEAKERIRNAGEGHTNNLIEGQIIRLDGQIRDYEGVSFPVVFSGTRYIQVILNDITDRKRAQETIRRMAYYDQATQLPNRTSLREQIPHILENAAKNPDSGLVAMFIGMSGLLFVKNMYTNAIGDKLVIEAVTRIRSFLRDDDSLFRYSERDFVAILSYEKDIQLIIDAVENMITGFRQPFIIDGNEYRVHMNVGINTNINKQGYVKAPIKEAYMAFLRARGKGKNTYSITSPDLNGQTYRNFTLQNDLYRAVDHHELELYYQPRVDPYTYQVVSAEALIRWNHPIFGIVSPGEFIPLAEESDLILSIGEWVIREACRQNKVWQDQGLRKIPISVNVSGEQMMQKNFIDNVAKILDDSHIDAEWIEFEVTESIFIDDPELFLETIAKLRKLGIKIALDDFGTGYSSLHRLKEIKCNVVKVDQSFVRHMEEHPEDMIIVESVIKLSHALGMFVVAEGVEKVQQFKFLKSKFCDEIQGYLFSKPIPSKAFEKFLGQSSLEPVD